ncbi:MAG: hypothetical protein ABSF44_09655 [Candidatus Bathyarchaeia archaeon]|jgi:hypothetical protein
MARNKRTNLYVLDEKLWAWASYKTKLLSYHSVAEYVFELIRLDKEKDILKQKT